VSTVPFPVLKVEEGSEKTREERVGRSVRRFVVEEEPAGVPLLSLRHSRLSSFSRSIWSRSECCSWRTKKKKEKVEPYVFQEEE
jgi:hypothetical protein